MGGGIPTARPSPADFSVYAELENEASELLGYACCQVPALLRTEAYARTLIMTARPGIGTEEVDRLVSECLARRVLVTRASAPLPATVILSEALVRCPVGGADVMAEQLRHLAGLAALPNVRLRVMPGQRRDAPRGDHRALHAAPVPAQWPRERDRPGHGLHERPDRRAVPGPAPRGAALPRRARGHARLLRWTRLPRRICC